MADESDLYELLKILQKLGEKERNLMLKLLPSEVAIEAFKVALRIHDEQRERTAATDQVKTPHERIVSGQTESTTTRPQSLARAVVPSILQDNASEARDQVATAQTDEEARREVSIISAPEQPTTSTSPVERDTTTKQETDSTNLNELTTLVGSFEKDSGTEKARDWPAYGTSDAAASTKKHTKKQTCEPPQHLPILLQVPEADGTVSHKTIGELPAAVRETLEERFRKMHSLTQTRIVRFRELNRLPQHHWNKPLCVRDCITQKKDSAIGSIFREHGRAVADKRCTKASVPCTFLFSHSGNPAFCIVPLPEDKRTGDTWTDIGFWLRPKPARGYVYGDGW
ncbi:hypothetical protein ACEQ8H_001465 [Pleosporales sp. CAS-2024a]